MTTLDQKQELVLPRTDLQAPARLRSQSLGSWLIKGEALLTYLFLYAPILILIIFSFNNSRSSAVWRGFTLDWYKSLLEGSGLLPPEAVENLPQTYQGAGILFALRNSMIVATISTVISTVFGTMIALGMERFNFRVRQLLDVMLYLPIIIPDITMGIAMAVFFNLIFRLLDNWFGISATFGFPTIIISHVAFNISFVAVVVRARLAGMDPSLEEAAQDCGANEWQTFRRVVLPLIMPGILGGALLAFTLSLDDFLITFFTAGVGTSTLPLFVYGMIRFSVTPAINAISTLMMLASMILVTIALAIQRQ